MLLSQFRLSLPSTSTMALYPFLVLLLALSPPSAAYPYTLCESEGDTYTVGDTFHANLKLLLTDLSSTNSTFTTDAKGSPPNSVYGLFLCRGDVNLSVCRNCVLTSTQNILQLCPYYKEATVWYDSCQLRYSDLSFNSSFDWKVRIDPNEHKVRDPDTFNKLRRDLLDKLSEKAANNSTLLFATGTASIKAGDSPEIYGLVQCTRDLSKDKCYLCLQENYADMLSDFDGRKGGRLLAKSCNFRYEVYKFFQGDPAISLTLPPSPPPLPPPSILTRQNNGEGNRNILIICIVVSVVVAFILTVAVFIFLRRRSAKNSLGMANPEEISRTESLYFELSILKVATANFSDANKLGQGGFGAVYKGTLPNGQDIAVKRLSANSRQGIEELKNELLLVAKLQHRNLVRLRGICLEEGETLLVYEYMPNGSLDKFLFDPIKCKELNWERRFKIIEGIARGLLYLHEESHLKVIHRDLKASNVLLDANMKPKISDFGLARLFEGDATDAITSRVVGTYGYMAPEYARRGRFSTKLDVYSYGILVLEIVTGRRNNTFKYDSGRSKDLLSYTWKHWRNGTTLEIVDPSLCEDYSRNEVFRCIQIGLLCAQEFSANRPSMSSVFLMLNSPAMPLQDPFPPAYLAGFSTEESDMSKVSSQQSYFGSTDRSSTSSIGSSQQSGPRVTASPLERNQRGKERAHSDLMGNQTFNSSKTKALASRLSQTEPVNHFNRD